MIISHVALKTYLIDPNLRVTKLRYPGKAPIGPSTILSSLVVVLVIVLQHCTPFGCCGSATLYRKLVVYDVGDSEVFPACLSA